MKNDQELSYELRFYLRIEPNQYFAIMGVLRISSFNVESLRNLNSPIMGNPSEIMCTKIVSNDQMHKALDYVNIFQSLQGVHSVIPMSDHKVVWKDLIPISVTTSITFFITINALYQLINEPSIIQLATIVGIPTVVTFLSQLLYKFLKN